MPPPPPPRSDISLSGGSELLLLTARGISLAFSHTCTDTTPQPANTAISFHAWQNLPLTVTIRLLFYLNMMVHRC